MSVEILKARANLQPPTGPVVLAILDGVGWGLRDGGDAVHLAHKPTLDRLWRDFPTVTLKAHGTAVGLPSDADMGNSEVGHNALGAGRVFEQGAALVQQAVESGAIGRSETWRWLTEPLRAGGTLHLCGLLSDGNVHSHIDHVVGLLRLAQQSGVKRVRLHTLADGRDVADPSFDQYVAQLQAVLDEVAALGCDAAIASGGGRMAVTMDRYEADWSMVARGWQLHVHGDGPMFASVGEALQSLRGEPGGQSDQTLGGFVIGQAGQPIGQVHDGDAFVFWNFRGDRAIEISRAFEEGDEFSAFDRGRRPQVRYAGMMQYDGDLHLPEHFLVQPPVIDRTMGEFLAALGKRTFAVSETQKYGHVTYFWNGNRSGVLAPQFERYAEVPSDRIAFDKAPAMQAGAIADQVLAALDVGHGDGQPAYDFVRFNMANGDMVGHTGNLAATVTALETVDRELGRIADKVAQLGGILVVTADHGNADDMWMRDKKNAPLRHPDGTIQAKTSHTLNPVPLTIVDSRANPPWQLRKVGDAGLANVAATLLELLGYEQPEDYAAALIEPASLSAAG